MAGAAVMVSCMAAVLLQVEPAGASPPPPGPVQAIEAATRSPTGALGAWVMRVKATGRAEDKIFLNSEADYRDQLNLSVTLLPSAVPNLLGRFGGPLDKTLRGKLIRVEGVARRKPVYFVAGPVVSSKYYFQTHVDVSDARQVTVLNEGG